MTLHRLVSFIGPEEKVQRQLQSSLPDGKYPGLAGGVTMEIRTLTPEAVDWVEDGLKSDPPPERSFAPSNEPRPLPKEPLFDRGREGVTLNTQMRVRGDGVATWQFQGMSIEANPNDKTISVFYTRSRELIGRLSLDPAPGIQGTEPAPIRSE